MEKRWMGLSSRRGFLRYSHFFMASLGLAACGRSLGSSSAEVSTTSAQAISQPSQSVLSSADRLEPTPACGDRPVPPAQTPGPFYKPNSPQRQSLRSADMPGTRLTVTGRVLSLDCRPLANCLLEFWQTDADGNYDNRGDRLRGHQFTDSEGHYRLETIVPGRYPGRTRHLHVRVQPRHGSNHGPMLTTQLYFPQDPLNGEDLLFQPELLMQVEETRTDRQARFDFVVEA